MTDLEILTLRVSLHYATMFVGVAHIDACEPTLAGGKRAVDLANEAQMGAHAVTSSLFRTKPALWIEAVNQPPHSAAHWAVNDALVRFSQRRMWREIESAIPVFVDDVRAVVRGAMNDVVSRPAVRT